ncbi:MAG TPA: polysaccharide deacetylase family protein [Candidatus Margulisiibacteriota bacterium]|nr:polysaccharide deacetylase family protein [Candidatus Margulisiibacteriota bacterium]
MSQQPFASQTLAVKVDVCTHAGMRDGVPALMRLFDDLGIRASFFVSLGPDHSGRAIRRIFRPGFLGKMLRTNAVGTYGWRTLLYGTLLPGPQIARSFPETLRALVRDGHEVGMHGYDHVYWQDQLPKLTAAAVGAELARARATFAEILDAPPHAFGAPGWQCTPVSFACEDAAGLTYHSDTRGTAPFIPEMNGQRFRTPDIPTTLPTLDEAYGREGTSAAELTSFYIRELQPGLNVYTAHAEMEGVRQLPLLRDFLSALHGQATHLRLIDVAARLGTVPVARVVPGPIAGRAGTVAWQEAAHG